MNKLKNKVSLFFLTVSLCMFANFVVLHSEREQTVAFINLYKASTKYNMALFAQNALDSVPKGYGVKVQGIEYMDPNELVDMVEELREEKEDAQARYDGMNFFFKSHQEIIYIAFIALYLWSLSVAISLFRLASSADSETKSNSKES